MKDLCEPSQHVDLISLTTLSKLDLKHLFNDIINGLYLLANMNSKDIDLDQPTKNYLRQVHAYCSKGGFMKKIIRKANERLKDNEDYLKSIEIKDVKKRTAQEAELLGVDITRNSIKQYRSEVISDSSSTCSVEKKSSSPSKDLKNIVVEKNQKRFILNSSSSCRIEPHTPKVQAVDRGTIARLCSLGIKCLEEDEKYKDTMTMKEFKRKC